jgi:hypothetical protein
MPAPLGWLKVMDVDGGRGEVKLWLAHHIGFSFPTFSEYRQAKV